MVCETLINKKLMYRLYAASRLTKICVLLLLILVKQMLDMASKYNYHIPPLIRERSGYRRVQEFLPGSFPASHSAG